MSALRLIKEQEISSATSVSITDVFSADFDIYCLTGSNISTDNTTHDNVQARFINASGSIISSGYDTGQQDGAPEGVIGALQGTNSTSLGLASFMTSDLEPESLAMTYWIFNPYSTSSYTFALWQGSATLVGLGRMRKGIGVLKSTASITGFNIYQSNSAINLNSGFLRVYGLRVDS